MVNVEIALIDIFKYKRNYVKNVLIKLRCNKMYWILFVTLLYTIPTYYLLGNNLIFIY